MRFSTMPEVQEWINLHNHGDSRCACKVLKAKLAQYKKDLRIYMNTFASTGMEFEEISANVRRWEKDWIKDYLNN